MSKAGMYLFFFAFAIFLVPLISKLIENAGK
jgi:hypothetical protein